MITGGGVKMPGMAELVKQTLKYPTQVGFPDLSRLEITNPAHHDLLDDPEFAVAIGLLLWSDSSEKRAGGTFGDTMKHIFKNLIP